MRDPRPDLAEAALACCADIQAGVDVDAQLLRIDALADRLASEGLERGGAQTNASQLSAYLAQDLGFTGDADDYHDPRNSLLTSVLQRRRGLPITLSILYVAIAERVGIPAHGVNAPAHFLVAIGPSDLPSSASRRHPSGGAVVVDPFHGGAILDDEAIDERIRRATAGLARFTPELLHPPSEEAVVRRLLDNLTRDLVGVGDVEHAVRAAELRCLLPGSGSGDVRALAELLVQSGRYRQAAHCVDRYLDQRRHLSETDEELRTIAVRARAKMN